MSQVVVVTGGAGGIGSAVCRALGEDGHSVVVADFNGEAAAQKRWPGTSARTAARLWPWESTSATRPAWTA